jgi:two-component system CheB/CheR fusion protein
MQLVFSPASFVPQSLEVRSSYFIPGSANSSGQPSLFAHKDSGIAEQKPSALVVDDVADVTEMISLFLRHAGFKVFTADSAENALKLARRQSFDIVISDIGMPFMNGYELAEALRKLPDYSRVPLIAVTGYSMYADRERALQSGFNAHLIKPIDPAALLDLINELRQ